MATQIKKYISADGTLRIAAVISTDLINAVTVRQQLSPLSITLVGRALTGAVLMASQLKSEQKIGLHFIGDGPIGSIFAEASYEGAARAYCENKQASLPDGVRQIGAGLGSGHLDVVRTLPHQKEPHRGTVRLVSGEIAEDLAFYFEQSHQIPSIIALTAIPALDGGVELAGGYVVELMPNATEETKIQVESLQEHSSSISGVIRGLNDSDLSADKLIEPFLRKFSCIPIEHPFEVEHKCICSVSRMESAVKILGLKTISDMITKKEPVEAKCEFCGEVYSLSESQLKLLLEELELQQTPTSLH